MAVLGDFTPLVQRISIDEAFLDVSGSVHLFGPAEVDRASRSATRVRAEIGLPISVGAARTKHLAKIASQVAKPDGLVVVQPGRRAGVPRPAPRRPRLGHRPGHASSGSPTAASAPSASWPPSPDGALRSLLGHAVGDQGRRARRQPRPAPGAAQRPGGSVGAQSALGRRDISPELIRPVLGHLADRVAGRLRAKHRAGRTVTVRVRFASMRAVTRSHTGAVPISATLTLTEVAERLVYKALADHPDRARRSRCWRSRCRTSSTSRCCSSSCRCCPTSAAPGSRLGAARWAVDHSIDAVRDALRPARRRLRLRRAVRSTAPCPTSSASSPSTSSELPSPPIGLPTSLPDGCALAGKPRLGWGFALRRTVDLEVGAAGGGALLRWRACRPPWVARRGARWRRRSRRSSCCRSARASNADPTSRSTPTPASPSRSAVRSPSAGPVARRTALGIGASWEHHGFPGLLSITSGLLTEVLVEVRPLADWAGGVLVVSGHGGNIGGLAAAVVRLHDEGRQVLAWCPTSAYGATGPRGHGGPRPPRRQERDVDAPRPRRHGGRRGACRGR